MGVLVKMKRKLWLTVDEFAQDHKWTAFLTYTLHQWAKFKRNWFYRLQNDPYWDKVDRLCADYLLKHGENPQFLEEDKRLAQKFAQLGTLGIRTESMPSNFRLKK